MYMKRLFIKPENYFKPAGFIGGLTFFTALSCLFTYLTCLCSNFLMNSNYKYLILTGFITVFGYIYYKLLSLLHGWLFSQKGRWFGLSY